MSLTNPQPDHPAHEELVAYLDGELSPEECRRVEERLAADDDYRQQLRELDQAWEALDALPSTAVDDSFARTTIELACVAAQEDLSNKQAEVSAVNSGRKRWWLSAGVAAAVLSFLMIRALAVHRNNMVLADLPVIGQLNALTQVSDLDFLRKLAAADLTKEMGKDDPAFSTSLADFQQANAASLADRRTWVESLSSEQKAGLAERSRAFEDLRQKPEEKDRIRKLANDIGHAPDAPELQKTLVAYGQWLSRPSAGEQQAIREKLAALPADERVREIERLVERESQQSIRHLSSEERTKLREEIIAIVKETKADRLSKVSPAERSDIEKLDVTRPGVARFVITEALANSESRDAIVDRLMRNMSDDTKDHWRRIQRWQRKSQFNQLAEWVHEAVQTKWGPEALEEFFASDQIDNDTRQMLLDKPRAEMQVELERLYQKHNLGIDERFPLLREFSERERGRRNGPPPDGGRPGPGQRRPEGPGFNGPPDGPPGRGGPPRDERFGPPDGRRPFDRNGPRGPRGDGPPPGPPGEPPPPPPDDNRQPL